MSLQEQKKEYNRLKRQEKKVAELQKKLKEAIDMTKPSKIIKTYEISAKPGSKDHETVAVVQYSDWHIDEAVKSESTMGLNEFNPEIARKRVNLLAVNTEKIIRHNQERYDINHVVINLGGDFITGWIHQEGEQTTTASPLRAIYKVKQHILSVLSYLNSNLKVDKITVVCISGNHSRTSRRKQYANYSEVNHEHFMYLDLKAQAQMLGLNKLEFIIPESTMAKLSIFDENYLFAHGDQFRYAGGIGGIYPPMLRWFSKISMSLNVKTAFIGHWHETIFGKNVIVNGSLVGYNAFAMEHGFQYAPPSQNLTLIDSKYGICLHQPIYLI